MKFKYRQHLVGRLTGEIPARVIQSRYLKEDSAGGGRVVYMERVRAKETQPPGEQNTNTDCSGNWSWYREYLSKLKNF